MNTRRITWFWPVSFLGALGQLLLLLTNNHGGPALGRFGLALWTLWLPGVWLGNLLTKLGTRLPARLPVQITCSMAVVYLALSLRGCGLATAASVPYIVVGIAFLIALIHLLVPPPRPARHRKLWYSRETSPFDGLATGALVAGLVLLTGAHLWTGAPAGLETGGADLVAAAARSDDALFSSPSGEAGRGLEPAAIDLVARLAALQPGAVWNLLPAVVSAWLLLALYFLGLVVFNNQALAVLAACVQLGIFTTAFTDNSLMGSGHPAVLALVPYWTAVALFLDGLDQPFLPSVVAFALAGFAVWATHDTFGIFLFGTMILVGIRSMTSMERLQEGLPLLIALWAPWLVLTAGYLVLRRVHLGALDSFQDPARDLLIVARGRAMLDPKAPAAILAAAGTGLLFLPALLKEAKHRATHFYLPMLTAAALLLPFNPWTGSWLAAHLGAGIHDLPWIAPIGFLLIAQGAWALGGIARSEGWAGARLIVLLGVGTVLLAGTWGGIRDFRYSPAQVRALRAAAIAGPPTPTLGAPHHGRNPVGALPRARVIPVDLDADRVSAGAVVRVTYPGRIVAASTPSEGRLRLELRRIEPPGHGFWGRLRGWRQRLEDRLAGRRRQWGAERPLPVAALRLPAGGEGDGETRRSTETPVSRITVVFTLPRSLVPGRYDVRAGLFPEPKAANRYRAGLVFLPPAPEPVTLDVDAPGR